MDEANYWEQYYINYYDSTNRNKGYNISPGGKNNVCSEEGKQKLRDYMTKNNPMKDKAIVEKVRQQTTGKQLSIETRKNIANGHKKRIKCIELNTIYNSRNEAALIMGVDPSNIGRAACGETETSCGYHWRYI